MDLAEVIDRAVALPPGPQLSAVLAVLPWEKVPNSRMVEVLQARYRQLSHEQAECYAGMVEISHAVAVDDLPGDGAETVMRADEQFEWASHEIAAGLTLTPAKSDGELGFAIALCERLPLVFAALQRGRIDMGKARVFVEYLDPATGDLTENQTQRLCERFVPLAPGLTTKQLAGRLYRALLAIDPHLRRRRYERAVQRRGVAVYLDPRTGTATLAGDGLPADEAAAAAARIDRMAEAARRSGHPGTLGQISSDLFLGMLDGRFHGLTEGEILDRILATRRPEDDPASDTDSDSNDGSDNDEPRDGGSSNGSGDGSGDDSGDGTVDGESTDGDADVAETADHTEHDTADIEVAEGPEETTTGTDTDDTGTGTEVRPRPVGEPGTGADGDRWTGERVTTREGIEIRAGLGTLAGLDERPGEIPGLGPVGAHVARNAATRQRRGARWLFAIVDTRGHLLLAGPLRRRPRTDTQTPAVRGGVVEMHLTLDELQRYATDPALGDWHRVLGEIARAWADRDDLRRRLAAHPSARFARGPLADHVCIRDRNCIGVGCTRAARRSDLDHTLEHARGGQTVEDNLGPGCSRHHPDKDRGWKLTQPEPGLFRWTSPLGRTYWTRGEPVRPDLPDPDPAQHPHEDSAAEVDQQLRRCDRRMLKRPTTDTPRPPPPPPKPKPGADDPPPPF